MCVDWETCYHRNVKHRLCVLNADTHLKENQKTASMWGLKREKQNRTGILLENADFSLGVHSRVVHIDSIIYAGLESLIYHLFTSKQEWYLAEQGNTWFSAFKSGSKDIFCLLILTLNIPADSTREDKRSHKSILNPILIKRLRTDDNYHCGRSIHLVNDFWEEVS